MNTIIKWFAEKILIGWFKKGLDKLPADGKKTIIALSIALLGWLSSQYPSLGAFVQGLLEMLQSMNHDEVIITASIASIVTIFHKLLKMLDEILNKNKPK